MLDKLVVKLLTLKMWLSSERGQDLVEYGLLTGGIAVVILLAVTAFSGALETWFNDMATWVGDLGPTS